LLQKLNKKLSRNNRGFTLIELMVAVAILALAALGIFQAFTSGFMSMAESRERTEAVNYARQALENIKNMDFEKVIPGLEMFQRKLILGTDKYEREININEISSTQKEVSVTVYWQGKDGELNTSASTLLTKMEFWPGDAEKIVLYVYPFNVLYPVNDSTELTAVIKDAKGNTVNYWEGDIEFEITVNWEYGYLDTENTIKKTVSTENGLAKCTFNSDAEQLMIDNEIAYVTIKASVPNDTDLGFDEVQIMLTPGPVRVLLLARETDSLDEFSSPVTVETGEELYIVGYILKANNEIFTDYPMTITFTLNGEGSINPILIDTDDNGRAEISYTPGSSPGTAIITGSATDLFSGSMQIFIAGEVAAIDISADPATIFDFESSTINCTLKDENGLTVSNPYEENIVINLEILTGSTGNGILESNQISIAPGQSSGTTVFTPSLASSGEVIVEATNSTYNLDPDTTTIIINEPLVPDRIDVNANPSYIKVGTEEISTITATVKSEDNKTITNYDREITFSTDKGVFDNGSQTITVSSTEDNYQNGQAWVFLEGGSTAGSGIATVSVTSNALNKTITGEATVDFYVEADYIELESSRDTINILGIDNDYCTITATIKDSGNNTVTEYLGDVTFSIVEGASSAKFSNGNTITVKVNNGIATVILQGLCNTGTVKIEASSNIGTKNIYNNNDLYINVNQGNDMSISLGNVSTGSPPRSVDYVIEIQGGDLTIHNLKISYNSAARITSILINDETIYEGNIGTGDLIQISNPKKLVEGNEYKITYRASSNTNIHNLSFETLLNPVCENEYYDFAIINFNT
jgi:prepilin-type N-terminal cleavage/methylation domain-containing protein